MSESKVWDLSADFAVRIIELCGTINGHHKVPSFRMFFAN